MKRILSCLLALIMLFQIAACAANTVTPVFADVPDDVDYAKAVAWCAENGLINGVEDGANFDPDGSMSRAMLATVLYRQAGVPTVSGAPSFTDALPEVWYSNAVVWASEKGLLRGYGNGLFGVDDPVSKEMLHVVIARQNEENPTWTGNAELAMPATRAEAAIALYETFAPAEPEPTPTRRPSGSGSSSGSSFRHAALSCPHAHSRARSRGRQGPGGLFLRHRQHPPGGRKVAEVSGGDLFEIIPAQPYTAADLNYNTDCRANREQNDPSARPAIDGAVANMGQYDVIFLGYPIWWGKAPKIIHTFLETYDLSGKTVATFCTSGGSGHEDGTIRGYEPDATWRTGQRFSGVSQVVEWVNGLELPKPVLQPETPNEEANKMYLQIGETVWTATLEENPSTTALKELLDKGPLTVDMHDYGGFEKVGSIGTTLTQTDRQITTVPGDIILYQGSSITIYYDVNFWNFTLLGHIDNVTHAELCQVLKASGDNVSVTFSLEEPKAAVTTEGN